MAAVSLTFITCKKGETAQSKIEGVVNSADSTASAMTETANSISNKAGAILDSANVRIKDFDDTQEDIQRKIESTAKSADSLSDKIASVKLESKTEKKDSAEKKSEKIVVNVPAPKVIKETKIVYKDKPKNDSYEPAVKNRLVKSGELSIAADNTETIKDVIKEETIKNNGLVKSEALSYVASEYSDRQSSDEAANEKSYYMEIKVPIRNFDNLMNDLSSIGTVESKNIRTTGDHYADNTICNIVVTITDKANGKESESFGGRSMAAISSGWNVITSIFLFLLPLWPLFLIAGIGYYFYKKRNKKVSDNHSH